jgi:signal transduction histidine kinase
MKTPTFNDIIQEMNNIINCDNISIHLDGDDECLFMLSTNDFRDSLNNMYKHHIYHDGNKLVNIKFINPKEIQEIITSYIQDNDIEDKIKQCVFKWLIRFKNNLCDKKKLSSLSNTIQQDLSTVLVSSQLLSRTKLDNEQRIHCKDITLHSLQVTKTINDLIDHYKLSSGFLLYNSKIFNINDFIENMNNSTRMNLNGVNIIFSIDDSIPEYIFADSDKIEQCILGILRLSEKYLIKNKYVKITIKGKKTENKNILVFIIEQYWNDKKIIFGLL